MNDTSVMTARVRELEMKVKQLESRLACATSFESLHHGFNLGWHIFKRSETEWVVTRWSFVGERICTSQDKAFALIDEGNRKKM